MPDDSVDALASHLTLSCDIESVSFHMVDTPQAVRAAHAMRGAYAPKLSIVDDAPAPSATDELTAAMFDLSPVSILFTRQRVVERNNAAATALIADGRPISMSGGRLRFDDMRAHAAFEQMSRADQQSTAQAYAFVVEGAGGRTFIAQLSQSRASGAVIVALTPFNGASQTREAMLNGFTDLTPTERSIFAAFVDGHDIPAIAAKMQRSVETVRWHVRNLFTKLGVNSQADLARLGALLLPI